MNQREPPDLTLLRTFHEVARAGSVTRAARNLFLSQPAVSHRLRALEADFGVRLFEKVGRGLKLTKYGRELQNECADLVARSQRIRDRIAGLQTEVEGRVLIGTLQAVASHILVGAVERILERHPRVAISIQFGSVAQLCRRLRDGDLDMAVVVGEPDRHGLEVQRLGRTRLVAAMAPSVAPRKRGWISIREMRAQRFLSYGGEDDPTYECVRSLAREHGLEQPYTPQIPHIESLRALAKSGAGFAILPSYTLLRDVEDGSLVALRPRVFEVIMDVLVLGRTNQVVTPAQAAVRDELIALDGRLDLVPAGP